MRTLNKKQNYFFDILKIGYEAEEKGISFKDLCIKLRKKGYDIPEKTPGSYIYHSGIGRIYTEIFLVSKKALDGGFPPTKQAHVLKMEYVARYLEYIELQETREASKKALEKANESILLARKSVRISIIVLVTSFILSIIIARCTISNDNRIHKEQMKSVQQVKLVK